MKILAVGGGSGGHVTPVVAVLRELKKHDPYMQVTFWCDRKFAPHAKGIIHTYNSDIRVQTIFSGKLRRYHNLSFWKQMARPFTIVLPNIRDMLLVGVGFLQSLFRLALDRPDVVFTKGGFVCLPVGMAARVLRIPLVIHDSDAHPGLTNRILAKWATYIATGAPLEYYPYPAEKAHYTGIPISSKFIAASSSKKDRSQLKEELGFKGDHPLVVVTGGGLGAARINEAVLASLDELLLETSVLLISGSAQYDELRSLTPQDSRFQLHAFITEGMARILNAADIVVTRAGATTLVELASLGKPTIVIPNGYLTGGHQLKNATAYQDRGAVLVLQEKGIEADATLLKKTILSLLHDEAARKSMSKAFKTFAKPQAAQDVAKLIIAAYKERGRG